MKNVISLYFKLIDDLQKKNDPKENTWYICNSKYLLTFQKGVIYHH